MSIERQLAIAERFINLIRPRFYNRITWFVIAAGLLLVAAPWWADVVNALVAKHLSVTIPNTSANVAWGFALVCIGLVYHIVVHYVSELVQERRASGIAIAQIEHDRSMLHGFFDVVTEQDLQDTLDFIASQHAYWNRQADRLYRAADYLSSPSKEFLDQEIHRCAESLASAIRGLTGFMGLHFFEYNSPKNGDLRFCMHPDLNVDRARGVPSLEEQTRYDRFSGELEEAVREVESKYRDFRRVAKRQLAA